MFYTFYTRKHPVFALWSPSKLAIFNEFQISEISTTFPLYISNAWSYYSHSDRNFPEAQAVHKQTSYEEKKRGRQREKGENSSVVHLVDDILCTLSVISFSSARLDRISPLSLWDDCFTEVPGDTFFLCLSCFSSLSLSLFLSVTAIFLKLYELVTTLFSFLTSSLTFSSQPGCGFNTCL